MSGKRARRNRRAGLAPEMQRHLRAIEHFSELVASDEAATIANIESRIDERLDELLSVVSGHDGMDVIGNSFVQNMIADPETYAETTHEGAPIVVELVALVVMSRDHAHAGPHPPYDTSSPPRMDEIQSLAQELLELGRFRQVMRDPGDGIGMSDLKATLALREATIRNAAYPHMLEDFLTELFGMLDADSLVTSTLGYQPTKALTTVTELSRIRTTRWDERQNALRHMHDLAIEQYQGEPSDSMVREMRSLWDAAWGDPHKLGLIDIAEIAAATGVPADGIELVVNALSVDLSERSAADLVRGFLDGQNPFRGTPIISDPATGRRMIVHEVDALAALRVNIERSLNGTSAEARYQQSRADLLEVKALQYLATAFGATTQVFSSFEHFMPAAGEDVPSEYTRLVECDGLLIVDDVAIVVEAKAGALSDRARSGNGARIKSDLERLITKAAEQAGRLRELILKDRLVVRRDRSTMDLSGVKEVYTVTVTLEDLNHVTTVTDNLVRNGLLKDTFVPWIVNLFDLRIVSEIVARPAEMLLYLRRRTLPELTRTVVAPDELDYFMYFLSSGLYVESDPDVEQLEWRHARTTTAKRRRFRNQSTVVLGSHTVALDDWYFFQQGDRSTPAPKPHINVREDLLELVDLVGRDHPRGWLAAGAALMSGDAATRREFASMPRVLSEMSAADGLQHTATFVLGDRRQNRILLVWLVVPQGQSKALTESIIASNSDYLSAKKHQMEVERASMLVFSSEGTFLSLVSDLRDHGPDEELDAMVAARGLRVETGLTAAQLTMRRRASNATRKPNKSRRSR